MRPLVAALLVLTGATAACTAESPAPAPAAPSAPDDEPAVETQALAPKLEKVPCRFLAPRSVEGQSYYCGDLEVPEDRRDASSRKIKLHVAVIKGKEGGIPTIELNGGPGGSADFLVGDLAARSNALLEAYGPILATGDLVLFDQRGVGRSVPRLGCTIDFVTGASEETSDCAKRLQADGINLAAYDTAANADDVHDLKLALGAAKVNLHGISYGTRLGLEILKRHGGDINAAIIDGVMPADVPIMGQFRVALDGVVSSVFSACSADAKCGATYPDLEGKLTALEAKLTATPFVVKDPYGDPAYDTTYDFQAFVEEMIASSYVEGTHGRIPFRINQLLGMTPAEFEADFGAMGAPGDKPLEDPDNALLAEVDELRANASDEEWEAMDSSHGMYLSVTCNDYAQHERQDEALLTVKKIRPVLQSEAELAAEFGECAVWPTRPSDPGLRQPTTHAGPVLVIGGALDPATPAFWARHAAEALANEQLVIVPTGGHGLMDACGAGLKGAFLADPSRAFEGSCATQRTLSFYYDEPAQGALAKKDVGARVVFRPAKSVQAAIADRVLAASLPPIPAAQHHLAEIIAHRKRR